MQLYLRLPPEIADIRKWLWTDDSTVSVMQLESDTSHAVSYLVGSCCSQHTSYQLVICRPIALLLEQISRNHANGFSVN